MIRQKSTYMHRISYLLSETDVNKSFAYYEHGFETE